MRGGGVTAQTSVPATPLTNPPAARPAAQPHAPSSALPTSEAGRSLPASPIIAALDTNHDGVIDADEIAHAVEALKSLDKNHDGKLTADEYRPQMQAGPGGQSAMPGAMPGGAPGGAPGRPAER
ncbi:MAG: hypothetical protein WCK77_21705 [Verrucomicrobiota bacterium]